MSRRTSAKDVRSNCAARKADPLKAPFPYFGGKSRIANLIWEALGDPTLYLEPFAGSVAALLARPHAKPRREVINDKDGFVTNFWRAVKYARKRVASHCDWPINELDLQARHRWICDARRKRAFIEAIRSKPKYFEPKIAAWWCWGIAQWIGGGWCEGEWHGLGSPDTHGSGMVGSHRPTASRMGVHSDTLSGSLGAFFDRLSKRLRRVDVLCGDWSRLVSPSVIRPARDVGIFLDPPYDYSTGRDPHIYNEEMPCTSEVGAFCREHGEDPSCRIVLAGLEGEYRLAGWTKLPWARQGGFLRTSSARSNGLRERLWLSPNCHITPAIRSAIRDYRRRFTKPTDRDVSPPVRRKSGARCQARKQSTGRRRAKSADPAKRPGIRTRRRN